MLSSFFSKQAPQRRVSAETARESLKSQKYGDNTFFYMGQGIGIILDEDVSGHKRIKRILKGSVAFSNGQLRVGDRVHEINGVDLWTYDIKSCSRLVSAAEHHVTLTCSRKPGQGSPGSVASSSRSSISSASPASNASTITPTKIATTAVEPAKPPPKQVCLIDFSPPSSPITDMMMGLGMGNSSSSAPEETNKRLSLEDDMIPHMGRQRSDSEASDTRTIDMLADMQVGADGRLHFTVMLEKGKIEEESEDFLQCMLYTKGHLSFIRGSATSDTKGFYERRWIAIRRGRIIVTKGHNSQITKSVDLAKCTISKILQSTTGFGPCEYFLGVKRTGKPTLYFGDRNRMHVEKLLREIESQVGVDARTLEDGTDEPAGYAATRHSVPEDISKSYRGMKH